MSPDSRALALAALMVGCGGEAVTPAPGGEGGDETATTTTVGDPCVPSVESLPDFAGHQLLEVSIDQLGPGEVCLAAGFQGRVTCPLGQSPRQPCAEDDECPSGACELGVCFDPALPDTCTTPDGQPVTTPVCSQCSERPAETASIRSCRCGLDEGQPDGGSSLCACPSEMSCELVRPYLAGLASNDAGKYCVHSAAGAATPVACGTVEGHWAPGCEGTANE